MRVPGIKRYSVLKKVTQEYNYQIAGKYINIKVAIWKEGPAQFAFSASKKCGSAPRRNRMRRIIREWVRTNYNIFADNTVWFIKFTPQTENLSSSKLSYILREEFSALVKECLTNLSEKLRKG